MCDSWLLQSPLLNEKEPLPCNTEQPFLPMVWQQKNTQQVERFGVVLLTMCSCWLLVIAATFGWCRQSLVAAANLLYYDATQ